VPLSTERALCRYDYAVFAGAALRSFFCIFMAWQLLKPVLSSAEPVILLKRPALCVPSFEYCLAVSLMFACHHNLRLPYSTHVAT